VRWTEDLRVSGTVFAPARAGPAHAELRLTGASDISGTLQIDWVEGTPVAQANAHGLLGGSVVVATLDAP
jgi:hypothetical protein